MTVPCCKRCNNEYLSEIENKVRTSFDLGVEEVRRMDKTILYKWIMKIIYCLLYKELSMKEDRKSKNNNMIVSPEFLSRYRLMFDYMMSIRKSIVIEEEMSSIFIFNVHNISKNNMKNINNDFFYIDDIVHAQFAILSNEIGIICSLGDSKVIEHSLYKYFLPFYDFKIHQIQFRQLIADVFYKRTLLINKNSFICMENKIIQIPPCTTLYNKYDYKEYAKVLHHLLYQFGFSIEHIYNASSDSVINLMINSEKRMIIYDEKENYSLGKVNNGYDGELLGDVTGKTSYR